MIGTFFYILFAAVVSYALVVALLRVSGKRTLSRMNTFDLIVVVALGSVLAQTILSEGTSLFQGIFSLAILAGLQYSLEWLTTNDPRVRKLLTAEPSLLFHRGQFLRKIMKAQRVSEDDVLTAVRQNNFSDLSEVEAVVLETNGDFSVIPRNGSGASSVMDDVGEA